MLKWHILAEAAFEVNQISLGLYEEDSAEIKILLSLEQQSWAAGYRGPHDDTHWHRFFLSTLNAMLRVNVQA